jgi:hypothetical protein
MPRGTEYGFVVAWDAPVRDHLRLGPAAAVAPGGSTSAVTVRVAVWAAVLHPESLVSVRRGRGDLGFIRVVLGRQ